MRVTLRREKDHAVVVPPRVHVLFVPRTHLRHYNACMGFFEYGWNLQRSANIFMGADRLARMLTLHL
jgi:hypothetical protein